jgi:hypothetical protein
VAEDGLPAFVGDVSLDVAPKPVIAARGEQDLGHALELLEHLRSDLGRVEHAERVLPYPDERARHVLPRGLADVALVAHVEARRLAPQERAVHVEERRAPPPCRAHGESP